MTTNNKALLEVLGNIPNTNPQQVQKAVQEIETLTTAEGDHLATRKDLELWAERLDHNITKANNKTLTYMIALALLIIAAIKYLP